MKILTHFTQGGSDWRDMHLGRPTASEFKRIITATAGERFRCTRLLSGETCGKDHLKATTAAECAKKLNRELRDLDDPYQVQKAPAELAEAHKAYAYRLAGERLTNGFEDVKDLFDANILRGIQHEPRARSAYEYHTGQHCREVGFILTDDGLAGCSPDGMVYKDEAEPIDRPVRGLEFKCPTLANFLAWKEEGILPAEHKAQVHGGLAVTGLPEWDFVAFHNTRPDDLFIVRVVPDEYTKAVTEAIPRFEAVVAGLVTKYRSRS